MGTKLIDGVFIHACLKEVYIPNLDDNGSAVAVYLGTIISLFRLVLWNFETIESIISISENDALAFLSSTSTVQYREDSPVSDTTGMRSSSSTTSSLNEDNWEEIERKSRILEAIEQSYSERLEKDSEQFKLSTWETLVFGQD